MIKFRNLKLGNKLTLSFGIVLFTMAAVTAYSLFKLRDLTQKSDEAVSNWLKSVKLVSEMNLITSDYRISELAHAITKKDKIMRYEEQQMDVFRGKFEQNSRDYKKLIIGDDETKLYKDINQLWEQYLKQHATFISLSRQNNNDEARKLLDGESKKLFDDFSKKLAELVDVNSKGAKKAVDKSNQTYTGTLATAITLLLITIGFSVPIILALVRVIKKPIAELEQVARKVAEGDLDVKLEINTEDELGNMATSFNQMVQALQKSKQEDKEQSWARIGRNNLNDQMQGNQDVQDLSNKVIHTLATYLNAQVGALYLRDKEDDTNQTLIYQAGYAFTRRKSMNDVITVGEGLLGQAALEKQMINLSNLPDDYTRIHSATGEKTPYNILILPFLHEDELLGVIELGRFTEFVKKEEEFLKAMMVSLGISFNSAMTDQKIMNLLKESQFQAEKLKNNQENLKVINAELAKEREALRDSETQLKEQQQELQVKADELEIASKYKSEFLANMSHELRTPLNSLLILAKDLADNPEQNLTAEQVEQAQIIHGSGNDLLTLINDILDLSKIEAGKMSVNIDKVDFKEIGQNIHTVFQHMTDRKGLYLKVSPRENFPRYISTDRQRLEQVLRNLLSNAIKFTEHGGVEVELFRPAATMKFHNKNLVASQTIGIAVNDTGIGISEQKQATIFEAFQQADGSTSRKYGGTGLGLSISREIARLLNGEIHLSSQPEKGSSFTLFLPSDMAYKEVLPTDTVFRTPLHKTTPVVHTSVRESLAGTTTDDQKPEAKNTILVIEDDRAFSGILRKLFEKENFEVLTSDTGEEGLKLAKKHQPIGIVLDVKLPVMSGLSVLDKLKSSPALRHIPVQVMSVEDVRQEALQKGAVNFYTKPVSQEQIQQVISEIREATDKPKNLLIVEDDDVLREYLVKLFHHERVTITGVGNGDYAINLMRGISYDCVVLDLGLPGMSGLELLEKLTPEKVPPLVVYTGKSLNETEQGQLGKYTESILIKGVDAEEKLLDQVALFLHQPLNHIAENGRQAIEQMQISNDILAGKNVLLVDDDMRNVFALSKILRNKKMEVLKAENGQKALDQLDKMPTIDLVLMDIQMPVMDGYEAMTEIRKQARFERLPIIALTANAMKEVRDKCFEAGANDYISKPVNEDLLLESMKTWLYQRNK